MKKLGIGLVVLVVLLVAGILVAPALVPQSTLKSLVQDRVRAATGRELTLGGDLSLSLVPRIAVNAADVALAGRDGSPLLRVGELQLALAPLPLLSGAVEVERFVLVRPEVTLAVDAQGRGNWEVDAAAPPEPATAGPATTPTEPGKPAAPFELALGEVRIEDGLVTYTDARSKASRRVEAIRLDAALPGLDSPATAKGSARVEGKDVALAVEVAQPRALIERKASPLGTTLDGPGIKLTATGTGGAPGFQGKVGVDVADLPAALTWAGAAAAPGTKLPKALSLRSDVDASAQRVALTNLIVGADQAKLTGSVTADLAGARPAVQVDLVGDVLDLRPFMPQSAAEPAAEATAPAAPATPEPAAPAGWPDTPLGLPSGLPVDLDAKLALAGLKTDQLVLGPTRIAARGRAERIRVELEESQLYGGKLSGNVRLQGAADSPELRIRIDGDGLQARPLLAAFAGFDKLEGTMRTGIELAGPARSVKSLMSGLGGRGSLRFADGAYVGVDLAGLIRRFTDPGAASQGPQRTDFSELSGTFTIADGILTNDDLTMLAPLLRLAGSGRIDLAKQELVGYRITPRAVATIKGQGGKVDARGLSIPFVLDGPWASPRITPDLAGAAADLLKDPKALERLGLDKVVPKGAEVDAVKDVLKGLLGGN